MASGTPAPPDLPWPGLRSWRFRTGLLRTLHPFPSFYPPYAKGKGCRKQYGALCFRYKDDGPQLEILVITSRETKRWVIPKGWPIKNKKPHETAEIEAWEEAGVRGVASKKSIGHYKYLKYLADDKVTLCIVKLFLVEVTEVSADYKERGQRILAWVSPHEAARRVRETELKSVLLNFTPVSRKLRSKRTASGRTAEVRQIA